MQRNLVIVTATISPYADVPFLAVRDVDERMQQYKIALYSLLKSRLVNDIIFCDNSNFGMPDASVISQDAKRAGKTIEFLQFSGDMALVADHGKGAGEIEILKFVLRNSCLAARADSFWKLTGRVRIKNIDSILATCKGNGGWFVVHGGRGGRRAFVETVFYKCDRLAFEKFGNLEFEVDDRNGIWLEHVMLDCFIKYQIPLHRFPIYPVIDGIRGSSGTRYNEKFLRLTAKRLLTRLGLARYV